MRFYEMAVKKEKKKKGTNGVTGARACADRWFLLRTTSVI